MRGAYIQALETRLRWLRLLQNWERWKFFFHDTATIDDMDSTRTMYATALASGDTYFMNKYFCQMTDDARNTVPDELEYDQTWPITSHGWCWLEVPAELPRTIQMTRKATGKMEEFENSNKLLAFSWNLTNIDGNTGKTCEGAINVLCYSQFPGENWDDESGFMPWSYFTIRPGDKVNKLAHSIEQKFSVTGTGDIAPYVLDRQGEIKHEVRWVFCALYLMAERLLVHRTTEHADRHTRKRLENTDFRVVPPPLVRVISLRRIEDELKKAKGAGNIVDWQCQWIVSGHWRNQPYKDGIIKPKWIDAYTKGPPNKPLKPQAGKIFAARR